MPKPIRVALIGAGAMSRSHLTAIANLPFFYDRYRETRPVVDLVASSSIEHCRQFASRYGIPHAVHREEVWRRDDIDSIVIASTNSQHASDYHEAIQMPSIQRIYIEKPVCVSGAEMIAIENQHMRRRLVLQTGFQFLQMTCVRRALELIADSASIFGQPVHFQARYLHGDYLDPTYRASRGARLLAIPIGGALVDLGCHLVSLIMAFLGTELEVLAAAQGRGMSDVDPASDLCTQLMLRCRTSGAVGTLVASRISAGSGDLLEVEIWYERSAIGFSTREPDVLRVFDRPSGEWRHLHCGSNYPGMSSFPGRHVPSGWLRSLIHAHYQFFGGEDSLANRPTLEHGMQVQRVIFEASRLLASSG